MELLSSSHYWPAGNVLRAPKPARWQLRNQPGQRCVQRATASKHTQAKRRDGRPRRFGLPVAAAARCGAGPPLSQAPAADETVSNGSNVRGLAACAKKRERLPRDPVRWRRRKCNHDSLQKPQREGAPGGSVSLYARAPGSGGLPAAGRTAGRVAQWPRTSRLGLWRHAVRGACRSPSVVKSRSTSCWPSSGQARSFATRPSWRINHKYKPDQSVRQHDHPCSGPRSQTPPARTLTSTSSA